MMKKSKQGVRSTALMGILDEGNNISDAGTLDNAWKGAEAYHFLMLCQDDWRVQQTAVFALEFLLLSQLKGNEQKLI